MTKRERNILLVAVAVGAVFLGVQALPAVLTIHEERAANIDRLRVEIDRERRLLEAAESWQQQRQETEQRQEALASQVFEGTAVPLISANIQRLVRDHATSNGIAVTSAGLAESLQSEGWLLVQQELSFQTADQRNLLAFLQALDTSRPWLAVNSFSVRRNRNQYSGEITVVGFSRTVSDSVASQGE